MGGLRKGVALGALRSLIEILRAEDIDSLPVEQIRDDLIEIESLSGWLETERVRRVAAFENRNGIDLEGHSSTTAFLKHRCRMTGGRAQGIVAMANKLRDLRFVEKALSVGEISLDQARAFINLPDHLSECLARDEVALVNAVEPLSVADTRRVVEYWRSAVDGPGCDAAAEELAERRYMHASRTWEGMVKVDGLLDAIDGDLFLTAIGAATPPRSEDDTRTPGQRRADALSDIARFFLDSGEAPGNEKPHVLVLTDLNALQGHGGGIHETSDGHVFSPEQIRQYACDCTISRVVFGSGSEPVDIGRASRVIPPAMRRAVIARDRHCQHPSCDRSARWCDVHHIRHWGDGGPTALWNLKLLCRYHHTREHRPAHRVTRLVC